MLFLVFVLELLLVLEEEVVFFLPAPDLLPEADAIVYRLRNLFESQTKPKSVYHETGDLSSFNIS